MFPLRLIGSLREFMLKPTVLGRDCCLWLLCASPTRGRIGFTPFNCDKILDTTSYDVCILQVLCSKTVKNLGQLLCSCLAPEVRKILSLLLRIKDMSRLGEDSLSVGSVLLIQTQCKYI